MKDKKILAVILLWGSIIGILLFNAIVFTQLMFHDVMYLIEPNFAIKTIEFIVFWIVFGAATYYGWQKTKETIGGKH